MAIGAIRTSVPRITGTTVPDVEVWETHEPTGLAPGPVTSHDTLLGTAVKASATPIEPASPPGTTNVPMILSRVFHASEI